MPTPALPEETLRASYDAVQAHGGFQAAGLAIGINVTTLRHHYIEALRRLGLPKLELAKARRSKPIPPPAPPIPTPDLLREPLTSFEDAWAQWMTAIGMAKDRYQPPVRKAVRTRASKIGNCAVHKPKSTAVFSTTCGQTPN